MAEKQKHNRKPFFRFVKGIIRIFRRKPKFEYLGAQPQGACIYVSNHSAASGPVTYELYLPAPIRIWGTYEMCGGFKMRWEYLNRTYYRRKKKYTRFTSFLLATFVTPFVALFYKGMRIIPTYPDMRLMRSVKDSVSELENGTSILVFPEDSSDGYHEVLTKFFGGFVTLAKCYHDKTGKDIDIVNMYYDRKSNMVIVGEPKSYLALSERFSSRDEIAEFFLNDTNKMFFDYVQPKRKK